MLPKNIKLFESEEEIKPDKSDIFVEQDNKLMNIEVLINKTKLKLLIQTILDDDISTRYYLVNKNNKYYKKLCYSGLEDNIEYLEKECFIVPKPNNWIFKYLLNILYSNNESENNKGFIKLKKLDLYSLSDGITKGNGQKSKLKDLIAYKYILKLIKIIEPIQVLHKYDMTAVRNYLNYTNNFYSLSSLMNPVERQLIDSKNNKKALDTLNIELPSKQKNKHI